MKRQRSITTTLLAFVLSAAASAYVINNWWPDGDNIVMDEVFLPAATWSSPAQFQMSEWNEVDVTDNSHPFRINVSPQFSFGANDGDNTIGFLGEAGLNSEYGLSYTNALAWAVCWTPLFGSRYDECDVMLDPTLGWSLQPHDSTWFQSTVIHELGHVRGLGHYNNYLSLQNSGTSKYLRNEILYMDDKEGVRANATHVIERDIVMYHKWHDGSLPRWMTMSPTTLREGGTINLNNITVENRGSVAFSSAVDFGIYLSINSIISTGDQLLNTGRFSSFGRFTFSTFNWGAVIPSVSDCTTRYIGGIIDYDNSWTERFEGNNSTVFTNGVAYTGSSFTPTALTILLAEDAYEFNDTLGTAAVVSLPFFSSGLSIDQDLENDYYRFTITENGEIDIDAFFTHSLGDVDLALLNSVGTTIATSASVTNNESITRTLTPGTYYVRVYGFGGGSCNRYSLDIDFYPEPTLTTDAASSITATSATLNATVNPNGSSTTVYFEYGLTTAYGVQTASVGVGAGNIAIPFARSVSGLQCGTLYHFRAVAENTGGTVLGNDRTLTTAACSPPTVTTNPATSVGQYSAVLNATVNPNGSSTTVYFDYGLTTSYGSQTTSVGAGSGTSSVAVSRPVTGLGCGKLYHFRAVASNDGGTTVGGNLTLVTAACPPPSVTTEPASAIGETSANLNATVNPNGASTILYFDYGMTASYGSQTLATGVGAGTSPLAASQLVTGMRCGTEYHFRALAQSSSGTVAGIDRSFTTSGVWDLHLHSDFVAGNATWEVCNALIVGPAFEILSTAVVVFRAGDQVVFDNGVTFHDGAEVTVELDP